MNALTRLALALCLSMPLTGILRATDPAPTEVTLTKRANNGPYNTSAYSFRLAS